MLGAKKPKDFLINSITCTRTGTARESKFQRPLDKQKLVAENICDIHACLRRLELKHCTVSQLETLSKSFNIKTEDISRHETVIENILLKLGFPSRRKTIPGLEKIRIQIINQRHIFNHKTESHVSVSYLSNRVCLEIEKAIDIYLQFYGNLIFEEWVWKRNY